LQECKASEVQTLEHVEDSQRQRVLPGRVQYAGGGSARVPQSEGLLKDTLSRLESQLLCIFANSLKAVLDPEVDVECMQTTDIYKPRAASSSPRAVSRPVPVLRGPSRRSGPKWLREGDGPICPLRFCSRSATAFNLPILQTEPVAQVDTSKNPGPRRSNSCRSMD
jgi:hypothetical protein